MSAPGRRPESGWYEVTVIGPIGPMLRRALEPCSTGPTESQTIVRAHVGPDVDLVDLTQRLLAHGSTVAGITALDDRAVRRGT